MKRLFLTSLSIVAISLAVATAANARDRTTAAIFISNNLPAAKYITPFELVGSAYQGQYRTHSIPGFGSFQDGVRIGRITAQDLVKAAIESENLPARMIDDRDYIRSVEVQLRIVRH